MHRWNNSNSSESFPFGILSLTEEARLIAHDREKHSQHVATATLLLHLMSVVLSHILVTHSFIHMQGESYPRGLCWTSLYFTVYPVLLTIFVSWFYYFQLYHLCVLWWDPGLPFTHRCASLMHHSPKWCTITMVNSLPWCTMKGVYKSTLL